MNETLGNDLSLIVTQTIEETKEEQGDSPDSGDE